MNQNNSKKEGDSLTDFVKFINSQNNVSRIKTGTGRGKPINNNMQLINISMVVLVAGMKSTIVFSLIGYELTVWDKKKRLTQDEMDELFDFVGNQYKFGEFECHTSQFDFTIMDGNSYQYFIDWNGINFDKRGGHTMPVGFSKLIDYCKILLNKR